MYKVFTHIEPCRDAIYDVDKEGNHRIFASTRSRGVHQESHPHQGQGTDLRQDSRCSDTRTTAKDARNSAVKTTENILLEEILRALQKQVPQTKWRRTPNQESLDLSKRGNFEVDEKTSSRRARIATQKKVISATFFVCGVKQQRLLK